MRAGLSLAAAVRLSACLSGCWAGRVRSQLPALTRLHPAVQSAIAPKAGADSTHYIPRDHLTVCTAAAHQQLSPLVTFYFQHGHSSDMWLGFLHRKRTTTPIVLRTLQNASSPAPSPGASSLAHAARPTRAWRSAGGLGLPRADPRTSQILKHPFARDDYSIDQPSPRPMPAIVHVVHPRLVGVDCQDRDRRPSLWRVGWGSVAACAW